MSIVGLDYGTRNCTIAVIRKGKLDIATNEVSMRYTPYVVSSTLFDVF
jgi:molecular chaperone DnaK (HSP70)